jgi:hypothetical protein
MKQYDVNTEASVGTTISTFLGTVALFFAGILMSRLESFDVSLRLPILYLLVATFGFVFSAIIYANVTGTARVGDDKPETFLQWGNVLSEYLGVYPFVMAIPLAVGAVTDDPFLRSATLLLALVSTALYTLSPFSMAHRSFSRPAVMTLAASLCVGILVTFMYQHADINQYQMIGVLILILLSALCFIRRHKV